MSPWGRVSAAMDWTGMMSLEPLELFLPDMLPPQRSPRSLNSGAAKVTSNARAKNAAATVRFLLLTPN